MSEYSFKLANYEDIPEIASIYRSLVGTPGCTWNSEYPNEETAQEDIGRQALYLLKEDDKIIAAASAGDFRELDHLQWSLNNPCELARIGVMPSKQNRGIGTIILRMVITEMKNKGYDGIRMLVSKENAAALAMYDKNGFERCGETFMYDLNFYCYQLQFESPTE